LPTDLGGCEDFLDNFDDIPGVLMGAELAFAMEFRGLRGGGGIREVVGGSCGESNAL